MLIQLWLTLLRVAMGWMLLYAGVTKLMNPAWTAAGYLRNAATFPEFYQWLAQPEHIAWVNASNAWGLTLLGVALLLGIGTRIASVLGVALMMLYYFPVLRFPYPNAHSYIVDEHIVYALVLLVLAAVDAGRMWGLDGWCARLPWCRRYRFLRALLG
ncbi:DoxX family membrane protein [Candidatus Uhrbacteria bacterium]|nr:DoxX family membrane protein [Candidatus Uhrbacteria bacterium]